MIHMRTPSITAFVALLLSCTDGSGGDLRTEDAAVMGASPEAGDVRAALPSASEAGTSAIPPGSSAWRPAYCDSPAEVAALPASPAAFSVGLSQTACFGPCPVYSMAVDQDGLVTYYGEMFVSRFGTQQKRVSAADARAIYDAVYQSGYGKLKRCYVEAVDGCRSRTESPSTIWNVSADGSSKSVDRYHGCEHPSPELAQVDATTQAILERAGLSAWVVSPPWPSPQTPLSALKNGATYRLSSAGKSLGLLTISGPAAPGSSSDASVATARGGYSWELADCAKAPLVNGVVIAQVPFYVLLGGKSYVESTTPGRLVRQKLPITLPTFGDVGSILVDIPMTGDLRTARAQRGDEDIALELVAEQPDC
jgi:hypothetical protein